MPSTCILEEYDIIFAGGGTVAGIVAARLAAADPSLRILLLETGGHTKDDIEHIQPGRFMRHLYPGSKTTKNVIGRPSEHLDGRELAVQCGQCVGGGSSINFAIYSRPPSSDYDDWAYLCENPSWSFSDLLPFIKRAETYQKHPARSTHGYNGPLKISSGGVTPSVAGDYLELVKAWDTTRDIADDANTMINDVNRHEFLPRWSDRDTGRRSDVAHHYLYPVVEASKNVHLFVNCAVMRVVIEDGRAAGVEYLNRCKGNVVAVARAKRLVVVSAGAFGSPAILERSGIGAKNILERNGVQQVVDLPGVGENYNDHPMLFVPFNAKEGSTTLDAIVRSDHQDLEEWTAQWHKDGRGLLATNGIQVGMKYRPSSKELAAIGPEFTDRWTSFYANSPDKYVLWLGLMAHYGGFAAPPPSHKCYCTGGYLPYPASVGSVHITSANDVDSPLDFDSGVLSRHEDLVAMRHLYKHCREQGRRMACYISEYGPGHPEFPDGSAAADAQHQYGAVDLDEPLIEYTPEDDEAIDECIKANVVTAWDSLGTCAMKPREQGGVVDSRLNVYGVQGLKVADMSICPTNVGANTYSVAVTIGEKAAAIFAEDLGIELAC